MTFPDPTSEEEPVLSPELMDEVARFALAAYFRDVARLASEAVAEGMNSQALREYGAVLMSPENSAARLRTLTVQMTRLAIAGRPAVDHFRSLVTAPIQSTDEAFRAAVKVQE